MANKVGAVRATMGELTDVDSSLRNPLGSVASDEDGGQYIYLQGIGSVIAGDWVTYDENFLVTRLVANAVGPVAVALAAVVADKYGWFCIVSPAGGVSGGATTIADNKACYADATTGYVDDTGSAGDLVCNAFSRSTDSAGLATFQIDHPFITDVLG